jgi:hypothetical protein
VLKHGLKELAGAVGGLSEFGHNLRKLLTGKAKKISSARRGWAV